MTKRFTNTDNGFIVDYESKQKVLNLYDVVELLNELATKCSQLEKENEKFKKQVDKIDFILEDLNGAEYITRDDAIEALNKIDKVIE